jgi:Zn-dependent peptidase ImmA (M78 family)
VLEDSQPIFNMVSVLESFSARAMELRASFGVDGAAARLGNEHFVVINPIIANVRVRMNAAHELAYMLYDDCKRHLGWNAGNVEGKAYLFASALLLPNSQLQEAFSGRSFLKLIQYKEKFGISLAAMIYRAQTSGIINTTASRWLWSQMAQRGWRQNEPGYVWRDRAINFEMLLESAIQTKRFTWSEAERITGVKEEDLQQRIASAIQNNEAQQEDDDEMVSLKFGIQG